ncbi:MAG TPA: hypothetical protein VFP95_04555 [Gammaproteobacteria bacterium]|nr:hypothetical protein [Gammaproteobacteria bacterium]
MIFHDFSDFSQALYQFALDQITWQDIVVVDPITGNLKESENANDLRHAAIQLDRYAYWAWWLRFGVGFENLLKAVFLRHKISLLKKRNIVEKRPEGKTPISTPEAAKVYAYVQSSRIEAKSSGWLSTELQKLNINHPLEINSGTLGEYRTSLSFLVKKHIISENQRQRLDDAIMAFSDIRRNVDAHVFLKCQVGGDINGDLTKVYLPACNLLIEAYK